MHSRVGNASCGVCIGSTVCTPVPFVCRLYAVVGASRVVTTAKLSLVEAAIGSAQVNRLRERRRRPKPQLELSAYTDLAADGQTAVMCVDDRLADRQSQAAATSPLVLSLTRA